MGTHRTRNHRLKPYYSISSVSGSFFGDVKYEDLWLFAMILGNMRILNFYKSDGFTRRKVENLFSYRNIVLLRLSERQFTILAKPIEVMAHLQ
jgi:hypothetical protein